MAYQTSFLGYHTQDPAAQSSPCSVDRRIGGARTPHRAQLPYSPEGLGRLGRGQLVVTRSPTPSAEVSGATPPAGRCWSSGRIARRWMRSRQQFRTGTVEVVTMDDVHEDALALSDAASGMAQG